MKTINLLASCLLTTTVVCAAEIRTVKELHNSLKAKYPDQIENKPGVTINRTPPERDKIVREILGERQQKLKGETGPEIQFTTKDGSQKRLSDLRGKPVILIFFLSQAIGSCKSHDGILEGLKQNGPKLAGEGIPVILVEPIMYQGASEEIKEQIKETGRKKLGDPYYTGTAYSTDTKYEYDWGVYGFPASFIIDGYGKVSHLPADTSKNKSAQEITTCINLIDALPPAPPAFFQSREITDTNGRKLSGTILEKSETAIKFRKSDGKEFDIPIKNLSAADQQFIKECQAAAP